MALSSAFASHHPVAVSLGPGETKRIDLREVLGPSSIGGVGGLSLSLPGQELISATQIVFDEVTGLAAVMKLFDREPDDQSKSRVLRAPMMALSQPDQGLGFPNGTQLLPRIFLRNSGSAATRVVATVDWRNQSSGTFALPGLTLSPGEVRTISLADYQTAGQIPPDAAWGTLKLAYTGRRADLVAVAISYDKTNRYGLQTPFSEALSRLWAGGMWHVDATHNTLITTGNGGSESTTAEVTLFYNGGKSRYRMEKMLSPGQQLWLDVGHLVHDQVPDSDGHTLPPDTMTGSYELRDLDHALVGSLYEGKLVIDKTYGHAAYGCGACCGYYGTKLTPNPFSGPPGINNGDVIQATEQCGGYVDDVTDGGYNWHSSNTAVATLPTSTLHTVAPGSATGNATVQLQSDKPPSCPGLTYYPTQPVTVQQFNVAYSAYIPVDNVRAPSTSLCFYQGSPHVYIYMGDANRNTYRVTESLLVEPDAQTDWGYSPATGQTRQYGAFSPKNGSTLSSLDEDGVASDCYLWNNAATASTSGINYDVSFPYSHQAQVHYDGSASNPLESQSAAIQWDMRTTIDTTNPSAPTALVNYNHTCYPSHQIKVNGQVVYLYTPPENDSVYIAGCLTGILSKIIGQQSTPTHVPPY